MGRSTPPRRAPARRRWPTCVPLAGRKLRTTSRPALQGRRRVGRRHLRASWRERSGHVAARADRPRHPARRQGLDPRNTRPEWTYACFGILAAGAHLRLDLPDQLAGGVPLRARPLGVARGVRRGRGAAREDPRRSRTSCPALEHVIVMDAERRPRRRALARRRSASAAAARDEAEWRSAWPARRPTTTLPLHLHVRHHRARRRAACSRTATTARHRHGRGRRTRSTRATTCIYLFLPLAHAFALLIQFVAFDLGATIAYWERDPQKIIPDLMEVKPTLLPVGAADLREDLHAGHHERRRTRRRSSKAVEVGLKVRQMRERGRGGARPSSRRRSTQAEEALFKNVRNLFGGRHPPVRHGRRADRAGDPRVLLRLRRAGDGGLRHDRDLHRRHRQPPGRGEFRFGSVGKPLQGVEVKIADDGEVLIKGPNIFQGYYKNEEATKETLERRLAAHRRPRPARRGRLPLHHRPQEGHHHHGGRQEHHAGQPRERPQAEPLDLAGGGDRRPAPVPGRADHARPGGGAGARRAARARGRGRCPSSRARCAPRSRRRSTRSTRTSGRVEQIKKLQDPRPTTCRRRPASSRPRSRSSATWSTRSSRDVIDRVYARPALA